MSIYLRTSSENLNVEDIIDNNKQVKDMLNKYIECLTNATMMVIVPDVWHTIEQSIVFDTNNRTQYKSYGSVSVDYTRKNYASKFVQDLNNILKIDIEYCTHMYARSSIYDASLAIKKIAIKNAKEWIKLIDDNNELLSSINNVDDIDDILYMPCFEVGGGTKQNANTSETNVSIEISYIVGRSQVCDVCGEYVDDDEEFHTESGKCIAASKRIQLENNNMSGISDEYFNDLKKVQGLAIHMEPSSYDLYVPNWVKSLIDAYKNASMAVPLHEFIAASMQTEYEKVE